MKTGALIMAAGASSGDREIQPLMKIGSITIVKRLILTLRQAGCAPIVMVTGAESEELVRHVSKMYVTCIPASGEETCQIMDAMKAGVDYIAKFCSRFLYSPVDVPMFTIRTLKQLLASSAEFAVPCHDGEEGYPLLIEVKTAEMLLDYEGAEDFSGVIKSQKGHRVQVEVQDHGVVLDAYRILEMEHVLEGHNRQMFSTVTSIKLRKEEIFFGPGTAHLLQMIENYGSMKTACRQMSLSYTKGWTIINRAEEQLGYKILDRKHGGKEGGSTTLSEKGKSLLRRYGELDEEVKRFTQEAFLRKFPEYEE